MILLFFKCKANLALALDEKGAFSRIISSIDCIVYHGALTGGTHDHPDAASDFCLVLTFRNVSLAEYIDLHARWRNG